MAHDGAIQPIWERCRRAHSAAHDPVTGPVQAHMHILRPTTYLRDLRVLGPMMMHSMRRPPSSGKHWWCVFCCSAAVAEVPTPLCAGGLRSLDKMTYADIDACHDRVPPFLVAPHGLPSLTNWTSIRKSHGRTQALSLFSQPLCPDDVNASELTALHTLSVASIPLVPTADTSTHKPVP